jgi:hypothetical protein
LNGRRLSKAAAGPGYERLVFHAWRPWQLSLGGLIAVCFILALAVGEDGSYLLTVILFGLLLISGFYLAWGLPTLTIMSGGPQIYSIFQHRRWRWSDVEKLELLETRWLHRPVLKFKPPGQPEVFIWGPWRVDGLSVVTAMQLGKARWNVNQASEPARAR